MHLNKNKHKDKKKNSNKNKWNTAVYMCVICVFFSLGLTACGESSRMYLEAEAQEPYQETEAWEPSAGTESEEPEKTCFVYICGAVKHPGVFEVPLGSRVYEVISLAGGLKKNASVKGINQAQKVADGDMIEILTTKEQQEAAQPASAGDGAADAVNINTASAAELMTLNGIGEAKAANIIAYRESNGCFLAIEELKNVSGIGESVYAQIKDHITVS